MFSACSDEEPALVETLVQCFEEEGVLHRQDLEGLKLWDFTKFSLWDERVSPRIPFALLH